jgi:hypothetical protein
VRDLVAWAGGCSLNCGSDWEEDLDIFSRPSRAGGGMIGCLVQCYAGVVRFCGMLICSLYPNGRTLCDVYEQDSKRENNGQLCTVASRNGDV